MDFQKQLGLDYLAGRRGAASVEPRENWPTGSSAAGVPLDPIRTLSEYGRPLLKAASTMGPSARVYDLVDKTQIPLTVALPVIDFLSRSGLIEVVAQDDLKGNHELRLTKTGQAMIE